MSINAPTTCRLCLLLSLIARVEAKQTWHPCSVMINGSEANRIDAAVALAVSEMDDGIPDGYIAILMSDNDGSGPRHDPTKIRPPDAGIDPRTGHSTVVVHVRQDLAAHSFYLSALLGSGMKEATAKVVDLTSLDRRAVLAVLHYLGDPSTRFDSLLLVSPCRDWPMDDIRHLEEALDYLQVAECESIIQTLQILHGQEGIRSELARRGWYDEGRRTVVSIPTTKKARYWRFWLYLLLSLQLLPEPGVTVGQNEFTEMLKPYGPAGDAITLRRELVEYGLIRREGDGSEYWRPLYTAAMMAKWIEGMPRPVV